MVLFFGEIVISKVSSSKNGSSIAISQVFRLSVIIEYAIELFTDKFVKSLSLLKIAMPISCSVSFAIDAYVAVLHLFSEFILYKKSIISVLVEYPV